MAYDSEKSPDDLLAYVEQSKQTTERTLQTICRFGSYFDRLHEVTESLRQVDKIRSRSGREDVVPSVSERCDDGFESLEARFEPLDEVGSTTTLLPPGENLVTSI